MVYFRSILTALAIFHFFLSVNCFAQFKNNKNSAVIYDQYRRVARDSSGTKLIYITHPEIKETVSNSASNSFRLSNGTTSVVDDNSKNCVPAFKRGTLGNAMGTNSMNTLDADNDGITEIICSATQNSNYYNGSFPAYWEILEYSKATKDYRQVWLSKSYNEGITSIRVFDTDGDKNFNIYVGTNNGRIDIYSANTLSIVGSINTGSNDAIKQMVYADLDNDHIPDFSISSNNKIYMYNITTNGLTRTLNIPADDFAVGNVDGDTKNELVVLSGEVYEITNSTTVLQWRVDLNTNDHFAIKLADVDTDGKKEVILAFNWQSIKVYDADVQLQKYEIITDIDISSLITKDVNNDLVDEIIYGDAQWGDIHCINASNNTESWRIVNPNHSAQNIQIADFDNNDTLDIIWCGGISSSGSDNLYITDILNRTIKWKSVEVDGPFYGVTVGDVDNDHIKEIVAISDESNSGYDGAIIQVYDYVTNELKWQSDPDSIGSLTIGGAKSIEVLDIDKDGKNEIVVASSNWYDGRIVIFDGITKKIKNSYTFYAENYGGFFGQKTDDINQDGINEIIVTNGNTVRVIDSRFFTTVWNSTINTANVNYSNTSIIKTGNIDTDPATEIVVCHGYLNIIDAFTKQVWTSNNYDYTNIDLYDFNNDNKLDIIAGNSAGILSVIDGSTKNTLFSFKVSNDDIDNVKMARIYNSSGPKQMVFTSNGKLFYFNPQDTTQMVQLSNSMGLSLGQNYSMHIEDLNADGKDEIIVGDNYSITVLPNNCNLCDSLQIQLTQIKPSCNGSNGMLSVSVTGGIKPALHWSNGLFVSSLTGLSKGKYSLTVNDLRQCYKNYNIQLSDTTVIAKILTSNEICASSLTGYAFVTSVLGTPPFKYQWSNGNTISGIINVPSGNYLVTITGNGECPSVNVVHIAKDTLLYTVSNKSCYGMASMLQFNLTKGVSPYYLQVSNFSQSFSGQNFTVSGLPYKKQLITITDSNHCIIKDSLIIVPPTKDNVFILVKADTLGTPSLEGIANIQITGSHSPYLIFDYLNNEVGTNSVILYNLSAGGYNFKIVNGNNCEIENSYIINGIEKPLNIDSKLNIDLKVLPNPSSGEFFIEGNLSENYSIQIIRPTGETLYQLNNNPKRIVLKEKGWFLVRIITDQIIDVRKLVIE